MTVNSGGKSYSLGWLLLLTLLTAFSALSTDMYLPALPMMGEEYGVDTQVIANTLGAYFLGLALGQLVYGPLSDQYGRKPPLYFGLMLYIFASFGCAIAPNENILLMCRVLQALGGCAGVVIARAVIRDCLDFRESAHVFSSMSLALGMAPIIAPILGAWLIQYFHWSSIFYVLTCIGLITLVLVHFGFKESLNKAQRRPISSLDVIKNYWTLVKSKSFILPMLAGALSYATLYCYLIASSNLFINLLHLSEKTFAYLFAINAVGLMFFAYLNKKLIGRYTVQQLFNLGCYLQCFGIVLLNLCAWSSWHNLYVIMWGLFLMVGAIGMTGPNYMAITLHSQAKQAGLASALMGCVQFFFGFVLGILLSLLPFNILQNFSLVTLFAILISLALTAYHHLTASPAKTT